MSLAIVNSRAAYGIKAPLVTVEVHLSRDKFALQMVGLPAVAVKESKERVRSAIMNSHLKFPNCRITISLAPADLPKVGGQFDLPIAIGILAASQQINADWLATYEFTGELALSGELRPIKSILPVALGAYHAKRILIMPSANAYVASLVEQAEQYHAANLLTIVNFLTGRGELTPVQRSKPLKKLASDIDLSDVQGQLHAKKALTIAAAGQHSLLYIGPPGTGKTMLASRLPSLLPELNETEALESAAIASVSHRGFDVNHWRQIPFRAPHHSSSSVALVGGGRPPQPGEISLAHRGILFLDELPEFSRQVLEGLREPLESGSITISRANFQAHFPANFQLIAAMNPCPCGYAGSSVRPCECSFLQIQRYMQKLSGPLLDRIDMQVEVAQLPPEVLLTLKESQTESSDEVKKRVIKARHLQIERQGKVNAKLSASEIKQYCVLKKEARVLLQQVAAKFNLSARVCHRLLKVAQTLADLQAIAEIGTAEISEALACRVLDKKRHKSV